MTRRELLTQALLRMSRVIKEKSLPAQRLAHEAQVHLHHDRYAPALAALGRAIAAAPRDPALYVQRAQLLARVNRAGGALADWERAARLIPGDDWPRFGKIRLLIGSGRSARAAREIAAMLRSGSEDRALEALFCRGCLHLKNDSPASAIRDFASAARHAGRNDNLFMRARFYELVARAKSLGGAPRSRGPRLYLCGLGLFPPYSATLEVLGVLGRCDILVNNVFGDETRELLSFFCRDVRPAVYDLGGDAAYWTARITALLRGGRTVAFVTRGHPLMLGGLGARLIAACARLGVACEAFAAVSSVDVLLASAAQSLGTSFDGAVVRDYRTLRQDPGDPARPLILTFDDTDRALVDMSYSRPVGRGPIARLQKELRAIYPRSQPCLMFGPVYDAPPEKFRLEELSGRFPEISSALMLFLPPRPPRA